MNSGLARPADRTTDEPGPSPYKLAASFVNCPTGIVLALSSNAAPDEVHR